MSGQIAEKTLGEILFATAFGRVNAHIEFLHVGADGVPLSQAFTFITMDAISSQRLTKALEEMNTSEFSDDVPKRNQLDVACEIIRQGARQLSGLFSSVRRTGSKG